MTVYKRSFIVIFVLLALTLSLALLPTQAQTTNTFCAGGLVTTLGAEGLPNLFRLGLRYGVSWPDIQKASGVVDVRRVTPEQPLCVPGVTTPVAGTPVFVTPVPIIITATPIPIVVTATPIPIVVPTATPFPTITPVPGATPIVQFTEAGYCAMFMGGAVPVDLGSCQLELLSIQLGVQSIVETGVTCEPRTLRTTSTGGLQQCSVRGDLWLTAPPVASLITP